MVGKKKQAPGEASAGDAPGEQFPLAERLKPQQLLPYSAIAKTDGFAVELAKLGEITKLLWFPAGLSEQEREARIVKALDLFDAIKPTDATESMLAAQMIGTHEAAMECLRRASLPEQNVIGLELSLKHAEKLMTLYTQQLAALDKHRGKGQQKITVERVTVQSGGQAIVGNIDAGAVARPPEARRHKVAPPQITSAPLPPNPLDGLCDAVPTAKSSMGKSDG